MMCGDVLLKGQPGLFGFNTGLVSRSVKPFIVFLRRWSHFPAKFIYGFNFLPHGFIEGHREGYDESLRVHCCRMGQVRQSVGFALAESGKTTLPARPACPSWPVPPLLFRRNGITEKADYNDCLRIALS
jgi:hypothetical protein